MKKFLRAGLLTIVSGLLLLVIYGLTTIPPIMRAMAAKTMCSCVFVSGRSPESVRKQELHVFPGIANIHLDINGHDSTITARLLWGTTKAIYRKGLGCTLLAEADESVIRKQQFVLHDADYPTQDSIPWPTGDLDAFGVINDVHAAALAKVVDNAFAEKVPEEPINTHAVVVVYRNKIILEKYAEGFGRHSILKGWSMTKSIANALIGVLVGEGKLSVNDPAPIDEWQNDDRKNITLNHLLQASSGLSWSELYFFPGAHFHKMFIHSDDKAAYALNRKLEHPPGEYFEYSGGTTNILSRIIRETVGEERYHRFPYESLFARIGMHHALIEPDASGTFVASSYGYASARDWARLGLLYLNDGLWGGERILPEGWVEYSTTPAPAAKRKEYGAQIWLNAGAKENPELGNFPGLPHEAIVFRGFEDNYVVIIPSKELVVVRLGVTHNDHFSLADLITGIVDFLPDTDTRAEN